MSKRKLYCCIVVIMIMVASSASYGEQNPKIKATLVTKTSNLLLSDADMAGYQLTKKGIQAWSLSPKDGVYRAVMGNQQTWTNTQSRELIVSYGSFDSAEEAADAASLFMSSTKQTFSVGSFTWQAEGDKTWSSSDQGKATIMVIRGKIVLSANTAVDNDEDRAALEAALLKVLNKL